MSATDSEQQKWLSSKLEASLMEDLDEKAKSIGLSRSEAVRKAIRQWVEGAEKPGASADSHAQIMEKLERIESRLASRAVAGPGANEPETSEPESNDNAGSSESADEEQDLGQMQMYEGEDLLNWIDSESEKSTGSQQS